MDKMTKKEMYERVIEIVKGAEVEDEAVLVEKLEHEIELLNKKKTGLTKTQKENEKLMEVIFDVIANSEEGMSATEVYEATRDVEGITSPQKVASLITKLVKAERVIRDKQGRNVKFSVVSE